MNLINDVTHDNDDSILFNDATDNDNVLITSPGQENENKVQKTLIPGSRNGAGIKGKANIKKKNELNFNYSELP